MPNTDVWGWQDISHSRYCIYTYVLTEDSRVENKPWEMAQWPGCACTFSTVGINRSQRQSSYKKQSKLDKAVLLSVVIGACILTGVARIEIT